MILSPVSIRTAPASMSADGKFSVGIGPESVWAAKGEIAFAGGGKVVMRGEAGQTMTLTVKRLIGGGARTTFVAERSDGSLVGIIAQQHDRKCGCGS